MRAKREEERDGEREKEEKRSREEGSAFPQPMILPQPSVHIVQTGEKGRESHVTGSLVHIAVFQSSERDRERRGGRESSTAHLSPFLSHKHTRTRTHTHTIPPLFHSSQLLLAISALHCSAAKSPSSLACAAAVFVSLFPALQPDRRTPYRVLTTEAARDTDRGRESARGGDGRRTPPQ